MPVKAKGLTMSFQIVDEVCEYSRAKGNALIVLIMLARRADDKRTCFPGKQRLATDSRCSTSGVRKAIRELIRLEEIRIIPKKRKTSGGIQWSNTYEILPLVPDNRGGKKEPLFPPSPKGVSHKALMGGHKIPKGGLPGNTIISQLNNQSLIGQYNDAEKGFSATLCSFIGEKTRELNTSFSQNDHKYLEKLLKDWVSEYGEDDARRMFCEVVTEVGKQIAAGKVKKPVCYLKAALKEQRKVEDGGYNNRFHYRSCEGIE